MSSIISNLAADRSLKRIMKKKMPKQSSNDKYQTTRNNNDNNENNNEKTSWKSETRKEVYSSKLMHALSQVRVGSESESARLRRGRAVREAADRFLAMADKGRRRWSRAILSKKLKSKVLRQKGVVGRRWLKKPRVGIFRLKSNTMYRKGRDLGRLVPGCRKLSLPVVLEEATDYIAALEMQVKAMAALAEFFSSRSTYGTGAVNLNQLGISQPPVPPRS